MKQQTAPVLVKVGDRFRRYDDKEFEVWGIGNDPAELVGDDLFDREPRLVLIECVPYNIIYNAHHTGELLCMTQDDVLNTYIDVASSPGPDGRSVWLRRKLMEPVIEEEG